MYNLVCENDIGAAKIQIFMSLTWKDCIFASICWSVKSIYRLSTKLKQKYNINHVNNFQNNLQTANFTVKKSFMVIFVIQNTILFLPTPHTKFRLNKNMPNYNCFFVNCYLKETCIYFFYLAFLSIFRCMILSGIFSGFVFVSCWFSFFS